MRSAARFQEGMTPFRALLTMASSDDSTTRAGGGRATSSVGSNMLWVFDHTASCGAITSAAGRLTADEVGSARRSGSDDIRREYGNTADRVRRHWRRVTGLAERLPHQPVGVEVHLPV